VGRGDAAQVEPPHALDLTGILGDRLLGEDDPLSHACVSRLHVDDDEAVLEEAQAMQLGSGAAGVVDQRTGEPAVDQERTGRRAAAGELGNLVASGGCLPLVGQRDRERLSERRAARAVVGLVGGLPRRERQRRRECEEEGRLCESHHRDPALLR
jgi:hypothetical protein